MQHDDDTIIKEDMHFLDLIESGGVQLSSKAIINGTTEIINDMKRVGQSAQDKDLVKLILARAYSNRAHCYFDAGKVQQAQDDFLQVSKLYPDDKEVKSNIKVCEETIREVNARPKFFTDTPTPQTDMHIPKAQRIQPNGIDQKPESPQGGYVKIGRQDSAFYKHEKHQRSRAPSPHRDTGHLSQPGGKTGRSK